MVPSSPPARRVMRELEGNAFGIAYFMTGAPDAPSPLRALLKRCSTLHSPHSALWLGERTVT